jgi:hypothetical protein
MFLIQVPLSCDRQEYVLMYYVYITRLRLAYPLRLEVTESSTNKQHTLLYQDTCAHTHTYLRHALQSLAGVRKVTVCFFASNAKSARFSLRGSS